ncbi:ATP-binding protein [uncultured Alistipes sp.]|uniref:ATP-binding protein n=1 Tax=uncultured Alistipes sp. TaxID=538949 RepID=UPI00261C14CE|nr:ATP-binding protein [uncultured Alistipes sp.]
MIHRTALENIAAKQRKMLADRSAGHPREIMSSMPYLTDRVLLIGGMRGCGRTTLLTRMLLNEYPEAWYTDFGDPRLAGFDAGDFVKFDRLLDDSGKGILLLNRIDCATGWTDYCLRKIEQGVKIVATVSLGTLLGIERQTSAPDGGRTADRFTARRLEPFSYTEFLDFTHKKGSPAAVNDYMLRGAFPGILKKGSFTALHDLYDDIIARDVIIAGGVRDRRTLQRVALKLMAASGTFVTANKIRETLKIKAVSTAAEHMALIEQAGLVSFVSVYSDNPARQAINPRKTYACDTALMSALSPEETPDRERLFETMIFNHLRRNNRSIHYTNGAGGCDFVATDADGTVRCIQTCYEDDPDRMEAKKEGLVHALRETGGKSGTIVTADLSDRLTIDGYEIEITDADAFLSDGF